jgi:hypothetical protein
VSALDDAREAVGRSDRAQAKHGPEAALMALRDAMRALIQHVEALDQKLSSAQTNETERPDA